MLESGADLAETIEKAIAALSTEDLEISAEVINMDFQEMQEAPKKKEAAPPAAAEEEEEEEAPKPKAAAKYMRVITWEIVPANTDADCNQCIEQIKSIQIEGVQWTGTPSVYPHVFGLSKIVIVSNITCDDDKSDAIMAAVEKLSTEETEFSAEAVNIDFQEMQAPPKKKLSELDQLKAELEAEKKKAPRRAQSSHSSRRTLLNSPRVTSACQSRTRTRSCMPARPPGRWLQSLNPTRSDATDIAGLALTSNTGVLTHHTGTLRTICGSSPPYASSRLPIRTSRMCRTEVLQC